jgi:hypothetical protein
MECPLCRLIISFRSISKHGHHMQFLFLIGRFLKKYSPLILLSHMKRNLVGSIYMYGKFCIKFHQSKMKGERHRPSQLNILFAIVLSVLRITDSDWPLVSSNSFYLNLKLICIVECTLHYICSSLPCVKIVIMSGENKSLLLILESWIIC